MSVMNNVLSDYDLEIRRLDNGLETTRGPKLITRLNADLRTKYKTKYSNKTYTPLEYINCISLTIGSESKTILSTSTDQINSGIKESYSSSDEVPMESR